MSTDDATTAPVSLTVLTATKGQASKRLIADADGRPVVDPSVGLWISQGHVEHVQLAGLDGLGVLLSHIQRNQALVHGIPTNSAPGDLFALVTAERYTGAPGTVARTLECFSYPPGRRLMMFDVDPDPTAQVHVVSAADLMAHMAALWPVFGEAGYLTTSSTRSAIRPKGQPDTWLTPPRGMHIYVTVTGDVARFRALLRVKLWCAGLGFCKLATPNRDTGVAALLERALVDLTVLSPERLDYVAGAQIARGAPFYQDRPPPELHPGIVLDLDSLPDATDDERQEYARRLEAAKDALRPGQRETIRQHIASQIHPLAVEEQEQEITQRLSRAAQDELAPDHPLYFPTRKVTAQELTTHTGKALDGKRLRDPQEPDYGPSQAVLHWNQGDWRIVSWAHGVLKTYRLARPATLPLGDDDMANLLRQADQQVDGGGSVGVTLLLNKDGYARAVLANVLIVLEQDPRWRGVLGYDMFADEATLLARPPYLAGPDPWTVRAVRDTDDTETANWMQQCYGIFASTGVVAEGLQTMAGRHPYHPVRDYLAGLVWDGAQRLDTWLSIYCNAKDSPYTRAVASKTLIGAVARVQMPGCKMDTAMILEGDQGVLKSTVWRVLASDQWFSDTLPDLHNKDAMQVLRGKWIIELGELAALQRSEVEVIKRFLSATQDHYRPSYGRRATTYPRQNIFVGSTNRDEYLKDETGNRRFWPVATTGACNVDALQQDRDHLWAEAMARYQKGDAWHLSPQLELIAAQEQRQRVEHDPWEVPVLSFVTSLSGVTHVTTREILQRGLGIDNPTHWTQMNSKRVAGILRGYGWRTSRPKDAGGKTYAAFFKPLESHQQPSTDSPDTPTPTTTTGRAVSPRHRSSSTDSPASTRRAHTCSHHDDDMHGDEKDDTQHTPYTLPTIALGTLPTESGESVEGRTNTGANGVVPSGRIGRAEGATGRAAPSAFSAQRCPAGGTHTWITRPGLPRLCARCNADEPSPCPRCGASMAPALSPDGQPACVGCSVLDDATLTRTHPEDGLRVPPTEEAAP